MVPVLWKEGEEQEEKDEKEEGNEGGEVYGKREVIAVYLFLNLYTYYNVQSLRAKAALPVLVDKQLNI